MISTQGTLLQVLKTVFPQESNIGKNCRQLLRYSSGNCLELDVWIPKYNISFEFQDQYHYATAWYTQIPLLEVQQNDKYKKEEAQKLGITLIEIPCWWDSSPDSLMATIHLHRPDIFINSNCSSLNPIPLNPPYHFFQVPSIPEVGELMLASFPANNKLFDSALNFSENSWWMGEKYDGIRSCWNPQTQKLCSRVGNEIMLIDKIIQQFPTNTFLDAELWFGRGNFKHTYQLINGDDLSAIHWHLFRVSAFDVPDFLHQKLTFEQRYSILVTNICINSSFVQLSPRIFSDQLRTVTTLVQQIKSDEGEGVILRKTLSEYEHGRSGNLLKYKGGQEDKEAIVVGRNEDRSVILKLPDGNVFTVPLHNIYVSQLSVGDIVSFSFENFAKSQEIVNPVIYQIRNDVSWNEIHTGDREIRERKKKHAKKFWTKKKMKLFFIEIAKKKKLDPMKPQTWYHISPAEIKTYKGGRTILGHFKGYVNTLEALFPDIGLNFTDISSFYSLFKFNVVANRRNFFEKYANDNNFDPLLAENWYSQTKSQFKNVKGARMVMEYYDKNLPQALMTVFPDIGLDKTLFYKEAIAKLRNTVISFAHEREIDPFIPQTWYLLPKNTLLQIKGMNHVVYYYKKKVAQILLDLFPNIGLHESLLRPSVIVDTSKQAKMEARRNLFLEYAKQNLFDPLVAENWYNQPKTKIRAIKGMPKILYYYNNKLPQLLGELFPDVGINESKFKKKIVQ